MREVLPSEVILRKGDEGDYERRAAKERRERDAGNYNAIEHGEPTEKKETGKWD